MVILNKSLDWYVEKIKNNEYFSQGMYGDGEWLAIFGEHIGKENAEGTIYTQELCDELRQSLHFKSDNFYFSSPAGLKNALWTGIGEEKIDKFLEKEELTMEFYEKDVWDKEMREGHGDNFIKTLQSKNVIIVSNKALQGLTFLGYDKFIEVGYPNCHEEVKRVVEECLAYGKSGVYLFSMGLPATLSIQQLHNKIPNSFFLDLGSIWDAFVGIGSQRGWRNELYQNKEKYKEWLKQYENVIGGDYRPLHNSPY